MPASPLGFVSHNIRSLLGIRSGMLKQESQFVRARRSVRHAFAFLRQRLARRKRRRHEKGSTYCSRFRIVASGYLALFTVLLLFGNSLHALLPHCHDQYAKVCVVHTSTKDLTQGDFSSWSGNHEYEDLDCPICSFFLQFRTLALALVASFAFILTTEKLLLTLSRDASVALLLLFYGRAPPTAAR